MTIRFRKPQRNRPYWRVFPVFNGAVDKSAGTYADNKTAARHETRATAIANADKPGAEGAVAIQFRSNVDQGLRVVATPDGRTHDGRRFTLIRDPHDRNIAYEIR